MSEMSQGEVLEHAERLFRQNRREEFHEFVEKAVEWFPDDPEIRIQYATALLLTQPDEAAAQAVIAIELEPDNGSRLARAADMLFHTEGPEAARPYAVRAMELMAEELPGDVVYGLELVVLGAKLAALDGHDSAAEEAFAAVVEEAPARPHLAADYAAFLAERGRTREAVVVIDKALQATPRNCMLVELRRSLASGAEHESPALSRTRAIAVRWTNSESR